VRLITFGDSWTAGHGVEEDEKYKNNGNPMNDKGFIMRLRNMNSWPRWVADKMDCAFVNNGYCGYSNDEILEEVKILVGSNLLKEDDVIIVMFSYPHRKRNINAHKNLLGGKENDILFMFKEFEKLLSPYKHFYFNSFYPTFKDEKSVKVENLPNTFIEPTKCVSDILKQYEIDNDASVWEYNKRNISSEDKSLWEGNYHPNLMGYKIIANYIYDKINNLI
jgi:hypothetical protein